jgi:hypothetical protein
MPLDRAVVNSGPLIALALAGRASVRWQMNAGCPRCAPHQRPIHCWLPNLTRARRR